MSKFDKILSWVIFGCTFVLLLSTWGQNKRIDTIEYQIISVLSEAQVKRFEIIAPECTNQAKQILQGE